MSHLNVGITYSRLLMPDKTILDGWQTFPTENTSLWTPELPLLKNLALLTIYSLSDNGHLVTFNSCWQPWGHPLLCFYSKTNFSRNTAGLTFKIYLKYIVTALSPPSFLPAPQGPGITSYLHHAMRLLSASPAPPILPCNHSQQRNLQNPSKICQIVSILCSKLSSGFLIFHSEEKTSPYNFIQGSMWSRPITNMTSSPTISPSCILNQPQGFCTCCSHSQDFFSTRVLWCYSFPSFSSLRKCQLLSDLSWPS